MKFGEVVAHHIFHTLDCTQRISAMFSFSQSMIWNIRNQQLFLRHNCMGFFWILIKLIKNIKNIPNNYLSKQEHVLHNHNVLKYIIFHQGENFGVNNWV